MKLLSSIFRRVNSKLALVVALFTTAGCLFLSSVPAYAALSPENPPVTNTYDQSCRNQATSNNGVTGFSLFMSPVSIVDNSWGEVTYRTYVCNGTPYRLINDQTLTRGRGTIVSAPTGVATGATDVFDYSSTGWTGPVAGWYTQDMGSYNPHAWRYQDVTFRVDGSKFPVSGNYRVAVDGKGRIVDHLGRVGETNTISMILNLTVIKTQGSTCTVTGPGQAVAPGSRSDINIAVRNGGNVPGYIDWNTNFFRLTPNPSNSWTSPSPAPITPSSGSLLQMNRTSTTRVSFTAPAQQGTYTLAWQLQDSTGKWYPDILSPCNIVITVGDVPPANSCSTGFYQIADGNLYSINPLTGQQNPLGPTISNRVQAIGYNVNDNFIYGVERSSGTGVYDNYLVRIASNGASSRISVPFPTPMDTPATRPPGAVPGTTALIAGDMDEENNLWYQPQPGFALIKLNVQTLTYEVYSMNRSINTSDMVYIGGTLYAVNTDYGWINRIDTTNIGPGNTINVTQSNTVANMPTSSTVDPYQTTSAWTSASGNMYVFQRTSGRIIEITNYEQQNPQAVIRSPGISGSVYSNTDGASCPKAPDPYEEPQIPFKCEPVFYQAIAPYIPPDLYKLKIDPATSSGEYTSIGNMGVYNFNAMGYNVQDNFIYGVSVESAGNNIPYIGRVGADGKVQRINVFGSGNKSRPFNISSVVGDFDRSGNLIIYSGGRVFKIDVASKLYSEIAVTGDGGLLAGVSDWVYINGSFYGIRASTSTEQPKLVRAIYEPAFNRVRVVGANFIGAQPASNGVYGAAWTTKENTLYVSFNNPGKIYRVDNYQITGVASADQPTAEIVLDPVTSTYGNDGASCPNAEDPIEKVNYPFLRVNGSDVVAGTLFGDQGLSCSAYAGTALEVLKGQIKTNGMKQRNYDASVNWDILAGSSSAQYAAFALGSIGDGNAKDSFLANNGYYRLESAGGSRYRDLLFANNVQTGADYGNYYSSPYSLPCVDIAAIEKRASPATPNCQASQWFETSLETADTGSTIMKCTGDVTLGKPITYAGKHRTYIVDGKLTIIGNVVYGQSATIADGVISAPALTVIALGGIDIHSSVTRLDGQYIAHDSILNTCSNLSGLATVNKCNNQLVVNGGIIGREIKWSRNWGTLNEDSNTLPLQTAGVSQRCAVATIADGDVAKVNGALNQCAAERTDFNPTYYFGSPFRQIDSNSIISSTPLSTAELPPIY